MRKAVIKDGKVVNVILAGDDFVLPGCKLVKLEDNSPIDIGWSYENKEFTKHPDPEPKEEPKPVKSPLEQRIEVLETEIARMKSAK